MSNDELSAAAIDEGGELIRHVGLRVWAELGRARLPVGRAVGLAPGAEDDVPAVSKRARVGEARALEDLPQLGAAHLPLPCEVDAAQERRVRRAHGCGQRRVFGASRMRMIRAGTPPTTAFGGTSLVTTAFAPTIELSPTFTPRRIEAL